MKMRKLFIITLIAAMLAFTGCASQPVSENKGEATVADTTAAATVEDDDSDVAVATVAGDEDDNEVEFDEKEVTSNLKVTPYNYSTEFGGHYLVLVIENKSQLDCELECSVDFYNKKDKIVGTESDSIDAFAAGTTACMTFNCDDKFKKYEYSFTAEELDYYDTVTKDLKCEVTTAKDKAIVSVKNNGKKIAQYVKANALFFKNDKLVYENDAYVDDKNSEIKPGKTEKEEISCYEKFDSVKVYLDARAEME